MLRNRSAMIFNLLDRDQVRADWHKRFENRSPATPRNAKPLTILNATGDVAEVMLYDEIGPWGITATQFCSQLAAITAPTINLRINSPGGDVFDGYAMYNALLAHPATINTKIEGLAASAASYVALAGDTVEMAETSLMMIHRAWGLAIGNTNDMQAMAGTLDKIDNQIAAVYAKKSGKPAPDMLALMDAETWLDPSEAKALGLIDSVADPDSEEDEITDVDLNRIAAMRRRASLADA
jgi:ATP-dependent protease ClpP protease subunit